MGCGASAKYTEAESIKADPEEASRRVTLVRQSSTVSQGSRSGLLSRFRKSAKMCDIIADNFKSYADVTKALKRSGLKSAQLMVGIDFTLSNSWNGKQSFGGHCLHDVVTGHPNPYMEALRYVTTALKDFGNEQYIPAYGFGDARTKQHSIFSFQEADRQLTEHIGPSHGGRRQ